MTRYQKCERTAQRLADTKAAIEATGFFPKDSPPQVLLGQPRVRYHRARTKIGRKWIGVAIMVTVHFDWLEAICEKGLAVVDEVFILGGEQRDAPEGCEWAYRFWLVEPEENHAGNNGFAQIACAVMFAGQVFWGMSVPECYENAKSRFAHRILGEEEIDIPF